MLLPLIVTWLLVKRLASLGEPVRLYFRAIRVLVILTFAVILFVFTAGAVLGLNNLGNIILVIFGYFILWPVTYGTVSAMACYQLWRVARVADAAAIDSAMAGEVDSDAAAAARALRIQCLAVVFAVVTVFAYLISLIIYLLNTGNFSSSSHFTRDRTPMIITAIVMQLTGMLDSVCNDFCTHILCFEVGTSSLEAAGPWLLI